MLLEVLSNGRFAKALAGALAPFLGEDKRQRGRPRINRTATPDSKTDLTGALSPWSADVEACKMAAREMMDIVTVRTCCVCVLNPFPALFLPFLHVPFAMCSFNHPNLMCAVLSR